MIRVADYIIDRLVSEGIKHIFLVTGRGILYLTDAVAKNKGIEGISTYHEQGASYAAMAYAAASDGMAACLVSTGCAATNAVTAALCAYQDNLPVIFVSGQHMLNETTRYTKAPIRTFGSQEADIIGIVESVTKYAVMLTNPEKTAIEMDKLFWYANEGRKGPVWIDVPLDIQNSRIDEGSIERFLPQNNVLKLNLKSVDEVIDSLNKAKRPVFFIGGGLRSAGAVEEFVRLVEKTHVPVVFSTSAADAYGSGNEMSIGAVGSLGGSRAGNFAIQNSDLVLAIGTKLSSQSIGNSSEFARDAKLIVIDVDKNEHVYKGLNIDLLINVDAKDFINILLKEELPLCDTEWILKCKHWKETFAIRNELFIQELSEKNIIDLYHFTDVLSDFITDDTTIITDAGLEELITPSTIRYKNKQRCLFPAAQGAMGYAIPAIIGAFYAGKRNIVTIVGDGSIMMNMQELLLIGDRKIPVTIFVINNNMYSVIRKRQKDLFRNRTIGNDPGDGLAAPNLKKIAESFDIEYLVIENEDKMIDGLNKAFQTDGPIICEVKCVEEQKYLHMSFAFDENRKLVKRPLEDLSPFIDREVFKNEMIIKTTEGDLQ